MTMQVITAALCTAKTKIICRLDLKVGDIAHFHGARFRITEATLCRDTDGEDVMCAWGTWIDGAVVKNYFGPGKPWKFQGNHNARVAVEI